LPRRRPLRTRRAPFRRTGLKQALQAFRSRLRKRWFTARAAWVAACAVGVGETVEGVPAWFPGSRIEGDRLVAGRDADGLDPLFPFVGVAWLLVSVEQRVAAKRAASALFVE